MLTESSRQLRAQHLDRHLPAMLHVLGEIHGRHPTATKLALDAVAVGEGGLQLVQLVGHSSAAPNRLLLYGIQSQEFVKFS
jgi:hypothetical protein